MIETICLCGKKLSVPDSAAGKSGKCPSCGKAVTIPPAVAKPAAPAPLELELEDVRPVSKAPAVPPEALYAPGQDLIGDDPKSKKKSSSKPPVAAALGSGVRPPGAPAQPGPDQIACPQCHSVYDKAMVFCTKCSVDLVSGKPVSGLVPGRALMNKTGYPEGYDPEEPFWKICLKMVYKPWAAMEFFQGYFERKNIQIQMLAFWILSFVAVGIAANNQSVKMLAGEVKEVSDEVRAAEIEKKASPVELWVPTSWTASGTEAIQSVNGKPFMVRVNEPQEAVEAGEMFTVKMNICEPGPGKGIEGDLWAFPTDGFRGRPAGTRVMGRSVQSGEYEIALEAELAEGAWFQFELFPKGADPETGSVSPLSALWMCWPTKPGWGMKVVKADQAPEAFDVEAEIAKRERRPGRFIAVTEPKLVSGQNDGMVKPHAPFFFKFVDPPKSMDCGKNYTIKVGLWQAVDGVQGEPLADMDVYFSTAANWSFEDDDEGEPAAPKFIKANPVDAGIWATEIESLWQRETVVHVTLCLPGTTPDQPTGPFAVLKAEIPSNPGWARKGVEAQKTAFEKEKAEREVKQVATKAAKVLIGGAAIVGAIIGNIVDIAISAAVFTLAARLLGGGGSFLLMALTLAFIQGFANFLQIGLLFIPEYETQVMASMALAVYVGLLRLIALMKVYDTSFGVALLASALAWVILQFVVVALVLGMMGATIAVQAT